MTELIEPLDVSGYGKKKKKRKKKKFYILSSHIWLIQKP